MSLGPGLRCVSTTGGTATSERTFWSFWERVEEGNWKRYKIGDSVVVARRFRSVPRSCPRPPEESWACLVPLPLLSSKRTLWHTQGDHAGYEVALLAQRGYHWEQARKASYLQKEHL